MSAVSSTVPRVPAQAQAPAATSASEASPPRVGEQARTGALSIDPAQPTISGPHTPLAAVTFHVATRGPAAVVADMLAPADVAALARTSSAGRKVWTAEAARRVTDELLRRWQRLYEEQVAGLRANSPELGCRLNRIGEFAQAELLARRGSSPFPVPPALRLPVLIHSRLHAGNARGALALSAALDRTVPTTQAELVKAAILEGLPFEAELALQRSLSFRPPLEAMVKHLEGRTTEARADLDHAAAQGVAYATHWVELAQAYGQIGDWQGALRSLARALRSRETEAVGVPFSAMWRPIHANLHVARVVHRAQQLAASKFVRRKVDAVTGITPPDCPAETR